MNSVILSIHIISGSLGITAGFCTLISKKGAKWHILFGNIFFYSMLAMAVAASYLAIFSSSEAINAVIGLFTAYLVLTGRWTAENHKGTITRKEKISISMAALLLVAFLILTVNASQSGKSIIDGVYLEAFYFFTVLAFIAFSLDLKVLFNGGVFGRQRTARHLWRMILALFIATSSLFQGQPQVFPESIQASGILAVPMFLVITALVFWIIRVYIGTRFSA